MKINNPTFILSAYKQQDFPEHDLPEFACSGRSNVGKSSLINNLVNRKKLAKTSSQPGRTQCINFFNIDNRFCLVDFPGYGFAKVPARVRKDWGILINDYLNNRPNLKGLIQIVDARHKPTEDDITMINWIKDTALPALIVATKADKVSRGNRKKQEQLICSTLGLTPDINFTFFSTENGEGKNSINSFILNLI